jgi:hypothetical protein
MVFVINRFDRRMHGRAALLPKPYMEAISWTKGIDQKTVGPHQEAVARGRQQLLVGIIQPKNAAPILRGRRATK